MILVFSGNTDKLLWKGIVTLDLPIILLSGTQRILLPHLSQGTADSTGRGWRLPSQEIERSVATVACQILSDQAEIATAAQAIGPS